MSCDAGDVVVVPFPFSERPGAKRRPALVLSRRDFNRAGHVVCAMITTKGTPPWRGDVHLRDLEPAGLPKACLVRLKLFTLDTRLVLRRAGRLSERDAREVAVQLGEQLSVAAG